MEVAATDALINRAFRRVAVRFREPVDSTAITDMSGVSVLDQDGGASLLLQVEGEMDRLIKVLAQYPVSDFETERPSLEEIFLAYYEADRVEAH